MKQTNLKSLITGIGIIILIGLIPEYSNAQKVTKLFEKGKYDKAKEYCEKQEGEKQQNCYKELADAYFGKKDYKKASELYENIANTYFEKAFYEKASELYEKAFFNNKEKLNEKYIKIAQLYIEVSNYDKADGYYLKSASK